MAAIELENPKAICSAETLAAVLDLSVRHVRRLTRDGVLNLIRRDGKHPRYRLADSIQRYLKHQKHYITADLSRPDDAYLAARTERMCALAKIEQMRVDEMRGRLHRAEDVEFCLTNMLTFMKQRLLAIPARITQVLIGENDFKTIYAAIDNEICGALMELSVADYKQMFQAQRKAHLEKMTVGMRDGEQRGE